MIKDLSHDLEHMFVSDYEDTTSSSSSYSRDYDEYSDEYHVNGECKWASDSCEDHHQVDAYDDLPYRTTSLQEDSHTQIELVLVSSEKYDNDSE